ncbi:uncharacterized protein DUF4312 [Entomoplasma freundtii]|uniref:Uncharacterized protein n=1 Tax=Entomoplasma freundtii TaxID=74700 RepID=A0A2K8NQN7_9MOLU|nr:DUF4312 family protein [Entomoplasma freundtii]ATZ16104.1 hypothetical protein EFREU_v1c00770 [Entomoplasma freundtii]TDY56995.1 uncharacterized protein DUF4312 [Entomoplasma freundtii]
MTNEQTINNPIYNEELKISERYQNNPNFRDENSILETKIDFLDVIGHGKTQKEAYTNAFDKLKESIYHKHNNFIIHLEPIDVIPLKDTSDLKSKKIMGLLPHKTLSWEINLRIFYRVKFIAEI